MTPSVLSSVTLGYELIWNQKRRCAGVRLFVDADGRGAIEARHLIAALTQSRSDCAPMLLLQTRTPSLLSGLLDQPPVPGVFIEIQDHSLGNTIFADRVQKARTRGVPLIWSGEAGQVPETQEEGLFDKTIRSLTPPDALAALRVSLRQNQDRAIGSALGVTSPVVAGCIYENLASQALLEHALDRQNAWAVAGWAAEEILHGYRFRQIQPSRHLLRNLIKSIETDESLDVLEHRLGEDSLLAYRFLRYANSALLGARCEVTSLRQGLMVMGYARLRTWLMEQIPHASDDPNLDPIRSAMVLRANVMERLCDAGIEDDLRREVFLCGIFSQLDVLLGEPLGAVIHRLPLPGRIASAVVGQTGPYAPWLAVATALESSNTRMIRDVCTAHKMPAADVNRALLHALASM